MGYMTNGGGATAASVAAARSEAIAAAASDATTKASAAQAAAIAAGLGVGQIWQNMTASRLFATVYTNTTGKPIAISVSIGVTVGTLSITTTDGGGRTLAYNYGNNVTYGTGVSTDAIIPPGGTYRVDKVGTPTFTEWNELR